ncbi:substrate-binding domain-containing protein [Nocardia sp. NPDC051750]|uniref:substrate-binding domain-containing protein n=1 Tax=Nocardia sp. NPDC051750 TaxID=3364325 RepID=UPI0037AF8B22
MIRSEQGADHSLPSNDLLMGAGRCFGSGDARAIRRRDGFTRAVGELLPDEPVRIVDLPDRDISMDTGVDLLDAALERFPEATAIMFATDVLATGAVLAAQRRGIAVPDRLAITGFGDFEMSRHLNPALTTVSVDVGTIGTKAAELLLARLAGTAIESATVDVGYRIVTRESA